MVEINNEVYFDTDCMSAFLKVEEMGSLLNLFKNKIVLPQSVFRELYAYHDFRIPLDNAISCKLIKCIDMDYNSREMQVFRQIMFSDSHYKKFGIGEAEVISYAVCNSKEMASNNLSDVESYIKQFELINHTVPNILDMMLDKNIKSKDEIEQIWNKLISKNFRLPFNTYLEYLNSKD